MILPVPSCLANQKQLAERIALARAMLGNCSLCEWRCGVDRRTDTRTPCRLGCDTHVFGQYMSLTEEPEVVPAVRVYLSGCNFRCVFCDTAPQCFDPDQGRRVEPVAFAAGLAAAIRSGAKSVSVLGGEPTLHVHTLLELAAASTIRLPLVINTNLYMTPEVIELLDGVVTLYLADLKFGNDRCARRIAGVPHYVDVVRRNLVHISRSTSFIVRHLLMPGHLECCFRPSVDWLAETLPGARFELYTGYVPCWKAGQNGQLGRLNDRGEIAEAIAHLKTLNLHWRAGHDGMVQCRVLRHSA